jgi:hypothetical protein
MIDLEKVTSVHEATTAQACNEYLKAGWVLLGTSHGKDEGDYPIARYSLGWPNNSAAVHP